MHSQEATYLAGDRMEQVTYFVDTPTVDDVPLPRAYGTTRRMFDLYADGGGLVVNPWRYRKGDPIDLEYWIREGKIRTVTGERP